MQTRWRLSAASARTSVMSDYPTAESRVLVMEPVVGAPVSSLVTNIIGCASGAVEGSCGASAGIL